MLCRYSGRAVPPNPGCTGTITRDPVAASSSANPVTDCGPAPPCSSRNVRPAPYSVTSTCTGPELARLNGVCRHLTDSFVRVDSHEV